MHLWYFVLVLNVADNCKEIWEKALYKCKLLLPLLLLLSADPGLYLQKVSTFSRCDFRSGLQVLRKLFHLRQSESYETVLDKKSDLWFSRPKDLFSDLLNKHASSPWLEFQVSLADYLRIR